MKCPHDGNTLEIRDSDGAVGFLCEVCEGRWLPHRYIEALQHQPLRFPSAKFGQLLVAGSLTESGLRCPGGCGSLTSTSLASILDWCRSCGGVWFEGEELKSALGLWVKKDSTSAWSSVDIGRPDHDGMTDNKALQAMRRCSRHSGGVSVRMIGLNVLLILFGAAVAFTLLWVFLYKRRHSKDPRRTERFLAPRMVAAPQDRLLCNGGILQRSCMSYFQPGCWVRLRIRR